MKIEVVMGKRFSSFVGLNFGVWVSFEKMGHYWLWGGGVDVRTKNVGIWLWGWVLFLSLFPLILFHQKAALRPGSGVYGTPGGIVSGHRKISASMAEHEKALVLKKNGLGAIGDLF